MRKVAKRGPIQWLLLGGVCCTSSVQALTWNDNYLGYRYGSAFSEPTLTPAISKHIFSYTHASGYTYGSNFLSVDVLRSDLNDPAANSSRGATEFYGVYRHKLSLSAISGRSFAIGALRDVGLTLGADWGSKDDTFAARPHKLRVGPTLSFAVPGFLDVGVYLQQEWNHNGIMGKDVSFAAAPLLGAVWNIKFDESALPLEFKGFLDYSGPKGKDGFGSDTRDELLMRVFVMADVSSWFGSKNTLWIGPGYEYWHNKFGNQPGVGTRASTPMMNVEFHL